MRRSAAMQLMDIVWRGVCGATGHSWERINHAMRKALHLAIQAGFRFNKADFATFVGRFDSGYWMGCDAGNMTGERFYLAALIFDNRSAAQSFEAWKNRPPFIVDRIEGTSDYISSGHFGTHRTGRLALSYRFMWKHLLVTVTSFADDGQSLTACTYKPPAVDEHGFKGSLKIDRRFKITIGDLRAEMTRRRKLAKAADEAAKGR